MSTNNDTTNPAPTANPNKGSIVAALTPIIAILASWLTGLVAKHVPGAQLDPTQVTAVMIATISAVLGISLKWLHGWQLHEARRPNPQPAAGVALSVVESDDPAA